MNTATTPVTHPPRDRGRRSRRTRSGPSCRADRLAEQHVRAAPRKGAAMTRPKPPIGGVAPARARGEQGAEQAAEYQPRGGSHRACQGDTTGDPALLRTSTVNAPTTLPISATLTRAPAGRRPLQGGGIRRPTERSREHRGQRIEGAVPPVSSGRRARRHVSTRTPITVANPAMDERKNTHQNSASVPSEIDGTPRPSPAIPTPAPAAMATGLLLGDRAAAGRRSPRRSRGQHRRARSMHSSGFPCPKHRTLRRPWEGLPQNRDDIGMTLRTVPDCHSHG